jgi:hypothetical protein
VGAAAGYAAGSALDKALTDGLSELAFPHDEVTTKSAPHLLAEEGAKSIDEARKQWWIGPRSAAQEH